MPSTYIPNYANAFALPDGSRPQAAPDSRDFDWLIASGNLTGVVSGCLVTAQGTPDMTVAVASGQVMVTGTVVSVAAGNVTIAAADGANPRFDLIVVDSAGAKSAVTGNPNPAPVFPDAAGKAVLASVLVPAAVGVITDDKIVNKQVIVNYIRGPSEYYLKAAAAAYETMPRHLAGGQAPTLTSGTMFMNAIYLPSELLVTSLSFVSGTVALATGTNQWFALYDDGRGGSPATLLRQTTNDTSTAWGTNTVKTLNLTSTFTTTYAGLYYLAIMVAATTVPTIRGVALATMPGGIAPMLCASSSTALTGTAPATAGAFTAAIGPAWAYVS